MKLKLKSQNEHCFYWKKIIIIAGSFKFMKKGKKKITNEQTTHLNYLDEN